MVNKGTAVGSVDEAKAIKWGVQSGTTAETFLADTIQPDTEPQSFQDTPSLFQALLAEQVDAVMLDTAIVLPQTLSPGFENTEVVGQFDTGDVYGIQLPKGSPNVGAINESSDSSRAKASSRSGRLSTSRRPMLSARTPRRCLSSRRADAHELQGTGRMATGHDRLLLTDGLSDATGPAQPRERISRPAGLAGPIIAVLLFFPTGIPALVHALRSRRHRAAGHRVAAARDASSAKKLTEVSVGLGLTIGIVAFLVYLMVAEDGGALRKSFFDWEVIWDARHTVLKGFRVNIALFW